MKIVKTRPIGQRCVLISVSVVSDVVVSIVVSVIVICVIIVSTLVVISAIVSAKVSAPFLHASLSRRSLDVVYPCSMIVIVIVHIIVIA